MRKISITPAPVFCPQPLYVIGTANEDGGANFSVITWIGFCWNGSPHMTLCIGGSKRTKDNLFRTGEFTANLVSRDILPLADCFGTAKGTGGRKTGREYSFTQGEAVGAPVLDGSPWVFECRVVQTVGLEGSDLFVARIENIQIDEDLKDMDREKIDLTRLDPVLYAPYGYFGLGGKLGDCGDWKDKPT